MIAVIVHVSEMKGALAILCNYICVITIYDKFVFPGVPVHTLLCTPFQPI